MGGFRFNVCDIPLTVKVKVEGKVKERRCLQLSEHVRKRTTDALAMIDDGRVGRLHQPVRMVRLSARCAICVSEFVNRGLLFDALYR